MGLTKKYRLWIDNRRLQTLIEAQTGGCKENNDNIQNQGSGGGSGGRNSGQGTGGGGLSQTSMWIDDSQEPVRERLHTSGKQRRLSGSDQV
jgi:hypothetical protein